MGRRITKPAHPKPVIVEGFMRSVVIHHWVYSRARDHHAYPGTPLGRVTRESENVLVLWDRSGKLVLNRYLAKPTKRIGRGQGPGLDRLAFMLLEEL